MKLDKCIFLDIDGVLNPWENQMIAEKYLGKDQYGVLFETSCVEVLKRIVDNYSSNIIISSTWRSSGIAILREMWKKRNLPGEVIDITVDDLTSMLDSVNSRGDEIQHFLDNNQVEDYLIIDDINLNREQIYVDGDFGLQEEDYQEFLTLKKIQHVAI